MPPAGFEPEISVGERSEILALDRAATGIEILLKYVGKLRLGQIMPFISFYFCLLAKLLVALCNGIGECRTQCVQICINRLQKSKIYKTRLYEGSVFRRGVVHAFCLVGCCVE
jgi:fucose permease